jgi:hypothetical protein
MTRTQRASELARLARLADSGRLCVGSDNPDVATILAAIEPFDGADYPERLRVACEHFASTAMTEAVRLGYVDE